MKKTELINVPAYYQYYINLVGDFTLDEALNRYKEEFQNIDLVQLEQLGTKVYAPGKWTVKQILQHVIDWERIFSYRSLVYVRQDLSRPVPHDENLMAPNSKADNRTYQELIEDFNKVRESTISLFRTYDREDLLKVAYSGESKLDVLGIGFVMVGHQIHHLNIIKERYLPLIG